MPLFCVIGDPRCQPDQAPPVVTITPASEVASPGSLQVTIDWCDDSTLAASGRNITFDGQNVTASFTYVTSTDPDCGAHATSTGVVTMTSGAHTLQAKINDIRANQGTGTATYSNYLLVSTDATNNDDQDMGLCAASCFAATYAQSTVPYYSFDQPRNVTLVYHGDRVAVRPFVYADVQLASSPLTLQKYSLQAKVNWTGSGYTSVTFTNGEQTLYFTPPSQTAQVRLAGQFDASSYNTGAYPLQVIVTAWYTNGKSESYVDSSHVLMVVNERKSPIARGWTLGGIPRLYVPSSAGVMITEGDGSARYYRSAGCVSGICSYTSPPGAYDALTYNQGTGQYTRAFPDSTKQLFNSTGRIDSVVDRVGNRVRYSYDGSGRLTQIMDPIRMYFSLQGCASGCPMYIALNYGSYGLTSIAEWGIDGTPGSGRVTPVTVGADSTLRAIQDPDGYSTQFRYDQARRLDTVINRRGDTTRFVYRADSSWKLAAVVAPRVPVDAGGGSTTLQTPTVTLGAWQVSSVPTGPTSTTPATPLLTSAIKGSVTDPGGHATSFTVNRWGQPMTITDAASGVTSITRSGTLPIVITHPWGGVDSARYNASGLPTWIRPAGRDSTSFRYGSGFAIPDSIWGPNQIARRIFLDGKGNVTSIRLAGLTNSTTHYYPEARGLDTLVVDPLSHATRFAYELLTGNLDSTVMPGGRVVVRQLDAYGRESVTWANGQPHATTVYDLVNRPIKTYTSSQADTTIYGYDPLFLVRVRDGIGQVYRRSVDALGRSMAVYDPADTLNRYTSYRYNLDGLLTSATNRRGQMVSRAYDALHRLTSKSGTNASTDNFAYSSNRRVMVGWNTVSRDSVFMSTGSWVDSVVTRFDNGKRFRIGYRPTSNQQLDSVAITTSTSIVFPSRKFQYDPHTTALLKAVVGYDTLSYWYDAELKRISTQIGQWLTRTDSFTTLHEVYQSKYLLGVVDTAMWRAYTLDSLGRIASIAAHDSFSVINGGQLYHYSITQANIGYDSLGRVARQDFGYSNGCGTTNPNVGLDCTGPGGFSESSYAYDAVGNLRMHFLNWLQGVQTDSTTYATGNRIQTAWGPGLTYEHDLDGNIRRKYGASTDIRYAWSADGRLTGDTVAATGVTIGYDYNAFGLLVRRTRDGTPDRYYLWEGVEPLAELDGTASNRIAEYAYLPGRVDQPFALITGATTIASPAGIRDVELDALGNVIGVLGSGSISVAQRRLFDLWGVKTSETGTLGDSAWLGWKALLWEGDSTQLYYVRNRWYDPAIGRFVSEDPIGLAGGINDYIFAGGDPVNGSDPSGLFGGPRIPGCLDRGCNHGAKPRLTGVHVVTCQDRGDCAQSQLGEAFDAERRSPDDVGLRCIAKSVISNTVQGAEVGAIFGVAAAPAAVEPGFEAGALFGAGATIEAGPVAILGAAAGGIIGAVVAPIGVFLGAVTEGVKDGAIAGLILGLMNCDLN